MERPTVKWVCACLGEWFDSPCNYTLGGIEIPEFMTDHAGDWCEENCGSCSPKECWARFFEVLKGFEEGKG